MDTFFKLESLIDEPGESCWIVVIQTNQYAGNFERDLCAYCTGVVGDCGVGQDFAKKFPNDRNCWYEKVLMIPDSDHGCYRPVTLHGSKSYPGADAKSPVPGVSHPVYNDVAILFRTKPTEKNLSFMLERANAFAQLKKCPIVGLQILGFHLVVHTVVKDSATVLSLPVKG